MFRHSRRNAALQRVFRPGTDQIPKKTDRCAVDDLPCCQIRKQNDAPLPHPALLRIIKETTRMNQRLAEFLVRYRLVLFLASVLFIAFSATGFSNFKYVADYKVFFAPDDPNLLAFEDLQDTFTRADNVAFVVQPQKDDVFSEEALRAQIWLTDAAWKLAYSIRVDSLANFQHTRVDGDELMVENLIPEDFAGQEDEMRLIRERTMAETMLVGNIVSPKADVAMVMVTLEMPEDQTLALPELMESERGVLAIVEKFKQQFPGIDLHVTGVAPSNYYLGTVASMDFANLMPILLLVVLILMGVMTKSISNTLVTLIVIVMSVVATMGMAGVLDVQIDNISAIAPMIIMTLAIADAVHLLSYYSLRLREGHGKEQSMIMSLNSNMRAVFFTSFTTALGFMGMNTIDSPPFVLFGYISSLGVLVAWVFSHTMLPQLAIWISRAHSGEAEKHDDKFHGPAAEWVISNPKKVFYGTLVVSLALSGCMLLNELNDDNVGYFGKDMPIRVATELAQDRGIGMNFIEYKLNSGQEYGVTDPAFLAKVDAFVQWAKTQPEVVHVNSFTDLMKRLNRNMHGDDPAYYVLPESRELASQYLLMYEMSLPQGMDLNNQLDTPRSAMRLTITTPMMKARENLAFEARVQEWLGKNAPEIQVPGASPTIMFSHIGQTSIRSVFLGTLTSIAVICLSMIFCFGSVRLGLMALLPNIFPSAITLGLWGIFVGEVNMGVAVIFTITMGIIVDDTIHLFTKFSDGLRNGLSVDDSIRFTFEQAGRGVLITTVVLSAGFAMMTFSDFTVNATLGLLVSGTIIIAILFDVLFLPSVLKVFPINPADFTKNKAAVDATSKAGA